MRLGSQGSENRWVSPWVALKPKVFSLISVSGFLSFDCRVLLFQI